MTGWILGCLCGAALLVIWYRWENDSLQTTELIEKHPNIPARFDGFRIVQVSDLHNKRFGLGQKRLLAKIRDKDPDIIVITGDLIYGAHMKMFRRFFGMEHAMDFVKGAVKIAPCYYVPGNHENRSGTYETLKHALVKAGVIVLEDQGTLLERDNQRIALLGSRVESCCPDGKKKINTETILASVKKVSAPYPDLYSILLIHHPEYFDTYLQSKVNLIFTGHAHGGQIRLPWLGALIAPGQGFFPKYTEGVYRKDGVSLVVSRGLGGSLFPFRINNRPELVCVTLRHTKGD